MVVRTVTERADWDEIRLRDSRFQQSLYAASLCNEDLTQCSQQLNLQALVPHVISDKVPYPADVI
jgi:hypothetical protein